MATSYLTSNELNNLGNEIFHCINQLKVWKKGSNIDNIHKQIIKINDFIEISKDYLLARLEPRMYKRSRSSFLIIPLPIQ